MISNLIKNFNRKEVKEGTYLTFKSSTPMTITPNYTNSGITLQYSRDAVNWINTAAKGVTPSSKVIYFRGRATGTKSLYTGNVTTNAWIFTGATNLEVNGEITMLLQDTLGGMVRDIPLGSYAFAHMFYNCTSLTTAPTLPATTLANNCYNCYNGMFRGCTSLTTAPALPATTLASACFAHMFYNCTSLTTAPALPATTLANNCYDAMFYSCTKIKISTTKTGSYQTAYRVPTIGTGVTATNALTNMFTDTSGTFTGTPNINTTYYTENTIV